MGFSWEPSTVSSLLYTFPLQPARWTQSPAGWHASVCFDVTQKVCLVSNFLCLLYFFVSKPPRFTRPPWKQQSNADKRDKIASFFTDKTSRGERVCMCAKKKKKRERDSTMWSADICCRPLQGWNVILSCRQKGLSLYSKHKKTSICPSLRGNIRMKWLYQCLSSPSH